MYPVRNAVVGNRSRVKDGRATIELDCGHVCALDSAAGNLEEQIVGVMEHGYVCRLCPSVERDLTLAEVDGMRKRVARGEFARTLQELTIPDAFVRDVLSPPASTPRRGLLRRIVRVPVAALLRVAVWCGAAETCQ